MPNKNYQKGYRFEAMVRERLSARGYHVVRQHASKFPDLYCLAGTNGDWVDAGGNPLIIECKVRKYLSAEEKDGLKSLSRYGLVFVAYPETNPNDKRQTVVVLARPDDYQPEVRLY